MIVLIVFGYLWAVVQLTAGEPFDALVLFAVTFSLHMGEKELAVRKKMNQELYRNGTKKTRL